MKKILLLSCGIFFVASVAMAETCSDGAGTVIVGSVTGHKYCMSNERLGFWNSYTWCNALGRRMFSMDDCQIKGGAETINKYHEMDATIPKVDHCGGTCYTLSTTIVGTEHVPIRLGGGALTGDGHGRERSSRRVALCC